MQYTFPMKKCYLCKCSKSSGEFYKDKTRKDGLSSKCKDCAKTYVKKNVDPDRTHKFCSKCKLSLPLSAFWTSQIHDGFQSACKTCRKLIPYGISPDDYRSLLEKQNGFCAICSKAKELVIDHCHCTGVVRGLLCQKCNLGLGHFEDSTERLKAAAKYLG